MFDLIAKAHGMELVKEYRFHPKRRFRFDWALPDYKIGIEYEGGTFQNGRHVRGKGYSRDCEKYNLAQILGWRVLRYTSDMLRDDPERPVKDVKEMIGESCL